MPWIRASVRFASLAACLLLTACAPTISGWGHAAAQGAMSELADGGAREVAYVVAAARDEALGPATNAEIQTIVRDTGATARRQLADAVRDSLADALGSETEARIGVLREQLVGAPLRADIDTLIEQETPRLEAAIQGALTRSLAPMRAEEERWRPVAVGLGVGASCLFLAVVALAIERRRHVKTIAKLTLPT